MGIARPLAFRNAASAALSLVLLLAACHATAEETPTAAATPPAERSASVPEDPYDRGTPRGAMEGYLVAARAGEWERAAAYFDLRGIAAAEREAEGIALAKRFKVVLDRELWVDVDALSDDPKGLAKDGLTSGRDLVGRIEAADPPVPIYLERVAREDGVRVWKISRATVREIPQLWDAFGDGELAEWLPEPLLTWTFLEVRLWQWIALLALALCAAGLAWLAAALAGLLFRPLFRRVPTLQIVRAPLAAFVALAIFSAGRWFLHLSVPASNAIGDALNAGSLLILAWFVFRLIDAGERRLAERLRLRGQPADAAVLMLGRRALKAAVAVLVFLAILQNVGVNVTGLLAGLGVGGIAVALAAQKSLENLFGGVTIVADQPVRVGDFCRFGDKVGTVEEIGLRSTRIRTLERTVITIPNSQFSSMEVENFARRDRFWYKPTLGLRYETTPDQIRFLLVTIREMLYSHPRVDPDPARIRFVGFGASSLDLEIFAYIRARDVSDYLEVAEDLNLRIMDAVAKAGTGFAFPSQTLYVRPDDGADADAARAAEEAVQNWRERAELPLPGFPPERVRGLAGTLDYPPEGSALRES